MNPKAIITIAGAVLAIMFLLILNPIKIVSPGYAGVKVSLGSVYEKALEPGFYVYNPITTSIHEMNVQTNKYDGKTTTYTKDIQTATLEYTINYNLEPSAAPSVYQTVGVNWADTLIKQVIEGELKSTVGKWDAVDLIGNREKARFDIQEVITTELAKRHVIITNFQITNIDYNKEFEAAVEAKVTAVQRAAEAQNKTVQIQEEAKQTVIKATADANAMKIKSDALSQNKSLVAYEAVLRWDGKLPTIVGGSQLLNTPASLFENK